MYEAVHARPDGSSTVARLARTASEYGFEGIVVRNHGDDLHDTDPDELARIGEEYGIDIVDGVEVRADDPSRASGYVGNYRTEKTLVCVHGGDERINRFAVEQPAVDVLAHPGGAFNHVLAKAAAKNSVRVEFSLRDVLRSQGGERVQALQHLRKLRELVTTFDVPYVVSGDPRSHLQLRAPRELTALGEQIGFTTAEIETGLAEWQRLAERNRTRQAASFVEPGVQREQQ